MKIEGIRSERSNENTHFTEHKVTNFAEPFFKDG